MELTEWLALIKMITIEKFEDIIEYITRNYQENITQSPVWRIHKVIQVQSQKKVTIEDFYNFCFLIDFMYKQENMGLDSVRGGNLTIHVFLSIYNCEIDYVKAISNLLYDVHKRDETHMLWQILGQMNTSIHPMHIMEDLTSILMTTVLTENEKLSEKICNPIVSRHESMIYTKLHDNLQCRLSLTNLREAVLNGRNRELDKSDGNIFNQNDKMLLDLPLNKELWSSKSSTQQQIILLIVLIQKSKIKSQFELISNLFGDVMSESIDSCVVLESRIPHITKYTLQLLPKINNNIDMSDDILINLLHQFSQDCFEGIFGVLQQDLMTMSFIVQMYIISYIDVFAQAAFYREIVVFFNVRIQNIHRELVLSEYISPQLISNMNTWSSKNKFSDQCMSYIFEILTI